MDGDLNDDWKSAAGAEFDGAMLRKSTDPKCWNQTARFGVSKLSLIKHKGRSVLYCKTVIFPKPEAQKRKFMYGRAVSDKLEGSYTYHAKPAYLYLGAGVNTTPGHGSCSHVFKMTRRKRWSLTVYNLKCDLSKKCSGRVRKNPVSTLANWVMNFKLLKA